MIKKLSIHQVAWYFLLFSIFGMILENITCLVMSGIIESRKGFIIGPFCPIYGLGAIILIVCLEPFKNSKLKTFIYGMIIGASFEYFSSYAMQAIYGVKFWDYPNYFLNINGRTCLIYAVSWGILSLILIYIAKPAIDVFIKKMYSIKLDKIIIGFMIADACITFITINSFMRRVELEYNYNEYTDGIVSNVAMKNIFPNMIYVPLDGKQKLTAKIM